MEEGRDSEIPEAHGGGQAKDSVDLVKKGPMESASSGQLVYVRRRVEAATIRAQGASSNSRRLEWEERYHHLQMLLNKLNDSDQTDHVQMLWSLSSAELSKHAVDLEKRSIQFSLDEAREMQRVAALNVLGRS